MQLKVPKKLNYPFKLSTRLSALAFFFTSFTPSCVFWIFETTGVPSRSFSARPSQESDTQIAALPMILMTSYLDQLLPVSLDMLQIVSGVEEMCTFVCPHVFLANELLTVDTVCLTANYQSLVQRRRE